MTGNQNGRQISRLSSLYNTYFCTNDLGCKQDGLQSCSLTHVCVYYIGNIEVEMSD